VIKNKYKLSSVMHNFLNEGTDLPTEKLNKGEISPIVIACKDQKQAIEKVSRGSLSDLEMVQLIAATIAVIGNESNYGDGWYYSFSNTLENWYNDKGFVWGMSHLLGLKQGGTTSIGPAQYNYGLNVRSSKANPEMKQFAEKVGITGEEDLNDIAKAALAVIGTLGKAYVRAKSVGYSNTEPSVPGAKGTPSGVPKEEAKSGEYNFEAWKEARSVTDYKGTGNAALDMAIMSYNVGYSKVKNYKAIYPDLQTTNYLPCYGKACISLSGNDSLVYVSQASKKYKDVIDIVKKLYGVEIPDIEIEEPNISLPDEEIEEPVQEPDERRALTTVSKDDIFGKKRNTWNQKKWTKFVDDAVDQGFLSKRNGDMSKSSWVKSSPSLGYGKGSIRSAVKFYDDVKQGKFKVVPVSENFSRGYMIRQRYGRY